MNSFWCDAVRIAVLLNPFAVLSTFLALAGERPVAARAGILVRTCLTVMMAGVVVMFCGNFLFALLNINLDFFKTGGGVVLMICAISLVWGNGDETKKAPSRESDASISIVPLAIPMALGPGTAAGLIVIGLERSDSVANAAPGIAALGVGVAVLAGVLALGVWAERLLNRSAVGVVTRLSGLLLSAVAAGMILEGVGGFLKLGQNV